MSQSKVLSSIFAATLLWAGAAQAVTLVTFEGVNGLAVNGTNEAPGVTQFNLGRSAGLIQNSGGTFNSRSWHEGTDKLSALAGNNSIFWGLTIDAGTPYDLTSLEIDYDRSNSGPTQIAIDLFINGTFQSEIFSDPAVDDSSAQSELIDLSAFTNTTGSVFFRLTGWDAASANGTFDIENDLPGGYGIVISGDAVANVVPLPAGLPLLAGGGLALAALRRKRRG